MPIVGRSEQKKNQLSIRLTGAPDMANQALNMVITALEQSGRTITRIKGPVPVESEPASVHFYINVKKEED